MNFYPRNRNIVIELVEEKNETQSGILLPEDYKKVETGLKIAKIVCVSNDGQFRYDLDSYAVIEPHLIQTFMYKDKTYTFIPESAVHGVLKKGPDYKDVEY
jgi:co-chaperonin GroES (HSP10)